MHISEFDFDLPPELIAQEPVEPRDASRMLVIDRKNHNFRDGRFTEFPSFFVSGDVVVINNTRVFPARLLGRRIVNGEPGAQVEAFLVKKLNTDEWEVLAKPGRALREGALIEFGDGRLRGLVTAIVEEGRRQIRFECDGDFDQLVDEIGNTPLPPYIKREQQIQTRPQARLDEPRYQTVYARNAGAVAAPTAGLHFDQHMLDHLQSLGVAIAYVTLHVGAGTFQPVRVDNIAEHSMHSESYHIPQTTVDAIQNARLTGGRVLAVGTTS
ncbi:MAG TPA: tRNA preQ1(34) S-adenosylmethionine ribosyltransferase-isomerase QueA, partial [Blastocatellia bacterium]|nr:tRNA preQ1(34) S-adenosylmethionine ribosyltransferase-isomerase QueA [Blastocatellia bacterium]